MTQESKKRIIRSGIETVKMDQRQVHRHLSKKDKNKSSRKLTGRNRQSQKRENIVLKKTLPNSFLLQNRIIEKKYLWIYRLSAALLVPVLFIAGFEAALRLMDYGYSTRYVSESIINGKPCYINNNKYSRLFFPENIARVSEPFAFTKKKEANTYRIFILGESAAQGVPDPAFSFARILEYLLKKNYPTVHFEIINTSMVAINSHAVKRITRECAAFEPDLFIVYLGNNEVVGPFGAGTVFGSFTESLPFINFILSIKCTKTGQLLDQIANLIAGRRNQPKVWLGMEMFLAKTVPSDSKKLEKVYSNFKKNLRDIIKSASEKHARVILCTVGSNLKDCAPFASSHRSDFDENQNAFWEIKYAEGIKYEENKEYDNALKCYLQIEDVDNSYAEALFRIAKRYEELTHYAKAIEYYNAAKEKDCLRFRADDRINEIISQSSKENKNIQLVDFVEILKEKSPNRIPGNNFFYEHVHLNFSGNYLLAKSIFEKMKNLFDQSICVHNILTEDDCRQMLAYSDWDQYRIADEIFNLYLKKAPFINQAYREQENKQILKDLEEIRSNKYTLALNESEKVYQSAIQARPADWYLPFKYAQLLEEKGDYINAIQYYKKTLHIMPHHQGAHAKIGRLYGLLGDLASAESHNKKAIELEPNFSQAHFNLGLTYQLQGSYKKSIYEYETTIKINPLFAPAYTNKLILLGEQKKYKEAAEFFYDALKIIPDNHDLHYNYGILLWNQGFKKQAIEEFEAALKINPKSTSAETILKQIKRQ